MVCRYCRIETGEGTNHGGSGECVQALTAEAADLRAKIAHGMTATEVMSMAPAIRVAALQNAGPDTFILVIGSEGCDRAVGPFTTQECRTELARLGVPPAAREARIGRARQSPPIG
jgi:hypothetical protein